MSSYRPNPARYCTLSPFPFVILYHHISRNTKSHSEARVTPMKLSFRRYRVIWRIEFSLPRETIPESVITLLTTTLTTALTTVLTIIIPAGPLGETGHSPGGRKGTAGQMGQSPRVHPDQRRPGSGDGECLEVSTHSELVLWSFQNPSYCTDQVTCASIVQDCLNEFFQSSYQSLAQCTT